MDEYTSPILRVPKNCESDHVHFDDDPKNAYSFQPKKQPAVKIGKTDGKGKDKSKDKANKEEEEVILRRGFDPHDKGHPKADRAAGYRLTRIVKGILEPDGLDLGDTLREPKEPVDIKDVDVVSKALKNKFRKIYMKTLNKEELIAFKKKEIEEARLKKEEAMKEAAS